MMKRAVVDNENCIWTLELVGMLDRRGDETVSSLVWEDYEDDFLASEDSSFI